jgi:hypothetical protein
MSSAGRRRVVAGGGNSPWLQAAADWAARSRRSKKNQNIAFSSDMKTPRVESKFGAEHGEKFRARNPRSRPPCYYLCALAAGPVAIETKIYVVQIRGKPKT